MTRVVVLCAVLALTFAAKGYGYCHDVYGYHLVTTDWSDGKTTGSYQWGLLGWSCTTGGGGSTYYPSTPAQPTGGGTASLTVERYDLASQYEGLDCDGRTNPSQNDFVSATGFQQLASWTFSNFKDPNFRLALIADALQYGLYTTQNNCPTCTLTITAGYRAPDTNAATTGSAGCSGHLFGTAADLSIRDVNGQHSCEVWNARYRNRCRGRGGLGRTGERTGQS